MTIEAGSVLLFVLVMLSVLGMPIAISIAFSLMMTLLLVIPLNVSASSSAQEMVGSTSSLSLTVIPFSVLPGIIMSNGGIVKKLVDFAMSFVGCVSGALVRTNVLGNALFGSISNSVIAVSIAIGGVLVPQQVEGGHDWRFATAVNIASVPVGMVIPLGTVSIMYSLVAGGASISVLFIGGYLVSASWALGVTLVVFIATKKNRYPVIEEGQMVHARKIIKEAILSLLLIVITIGGISTGILAAVEASAIAVIYSPSIAMFCYKTVKLKDIPDILSQSVAMSGTIMFLLATSSMTSFAMASTSAPQAIGSLVMGVTDNRFIILLLVNLVLLLVGMLMDMILAILIFIPISLPIVTGVGVDPIHYGLFSIMSLCVDSTTPPVDTGLHVGASVGDMKAGTTLKPLPPLHGVILVVLPLVTYFLQVVMWLSNVLGQKNSYVEHYN